MFAIYIVKLKHFIYKTYKSWYNYNIKTNITRESGVFKFILRKKVLTMSKNKIIVIFIIIPVVGVWLFPVKRTINSNKFDINEYVQNNKVVILCNGVNTTGAKFVVTDSAGIDICPRYISDLTGNSPELYLKRHVDDNYDDVNFLCIGNFTENIGNLEDSYAFEVSEWYTVENIERRFNIIYYPSYGFNLFEIKY